MKKINNAGFTAWQIKDLSAPSLTLSRNGGWERFRISAAPHRRCTNAHTPLVGSVSQSACALSSTLAFTLAEVLITLAIIGVVAALTIPSVVRNYQETAAVSRVKKHYRNIAAAVQQWQVEEGCSDDVRNCPNITSSTQNAFKGIAEKLQIVKTQYGINGLENVDWLPDHTTLLNGSKADYAWQGVSKNSGGYTSTCYYLLADGTTMSVTREGSGSQLYLYIDVNGKKAPNRVGKDVFPIGIGAYGSTRYSTVHPHIPDDDTQGGVCRLTNKDSYCDPDVCTKTLCAPTAYVLKYSKLPPITW